MVLKSLLSVPTYGFLFLLSCSHLPFLLLAPQLCPRALAVPCASGPSWLWMVPVEGPSGCLVCREVQVTEWLLSLWLGNRASHTVLSRECRRLAKGLSGTHPAEELCVMQAWCCSWASHNHLNAVHSQIANFSLLGIPWLMAARSSLCTTGAGTASTAIPEPGIHTFSWKPFCSVELLSLKLST